MKRVITRLGVWSLRAIAFLIFVFPLANFALVAADVWVPEKPSVVRFSPEMDRSMESPEGPFVTKAEWMWEPRAGALIDFDVVNPEGYRGPPVPIA